MMSAMKSGFLQGSSGLGETRQGKKTMIVRSVHGQEEKMDFASDETIGQWKKVAAPRFGVTSKKMIKKLVLTCKGEVLPEDGTAADLNIADMETLFIKSKSSSVKPDVDDVAEEVEPCAEPLTVEPCAEPIDKPAAQIKPEPKNEIHQRLFPLCAEPIDKPAAQIKPEPKNKTHQRLRQRLEQQKQLEKIASEKLAPHTEGTEVPATPPQVASEQSAPEAEGTEVPAVPAQVVPSDEHNSEAKPTKKQNKRQKRKHVTKEAVHVAPPLPDLSEPVPTAKEDECDKVADSENQSTDEPVDLEGSSDSTLEPRPSPLAKPGAPNTKVATRQRYQEKLAAQRRQRCGW